MNHSLKTLWVAIAAALIALSSSCKRTSASGTDLTATSDTAFVIEGTVEHIDDIIFPAGAKIWLVPFFGPHPRPVDSCIVEPDGKFRFEGNNELFATIRLSAKVRYGYQDLLVVTQPGTIHATIGAVSTGSGTPMNDALEDWKHHIEDYRTAMYECVQQLRSGAIDSASYKINTEKLNTEAGAYVYEFLHSHGSNTLTRALNTIRFGKLTDEQKAELDELLKDTTNYDLPQPGFRR